MRLSFDFVRGRSRTQWVFFALLLLLLASRWLLIAARPSAQPTLTSQALGCLWAAMVYMTLNLGRAERGRAQRLPVLRCLMAGALLLGGPPIAVLLQTPYVPASSMTLALCLTPLVIAVAGRALGGGRTGGLSGQLWPSLAALAGLLLLVAQPSLSNLRTDLALVLAPLCTGAGAAMFVAIQTARRDHTPLIATLALTGGAVVFSVGPGVAYLMGTPITLSVSAIACDGLIALLSVTVLSHLLAERWSAQFVLAPLLIVLEGAVLSRPQIDLRSVAGLALLAAGGVYLLLPAATDEEPSVVPHS